MSKIKLNQIAIPFFYNEGRATVEGKLGNQWYPYAENVTSFATEGWSEKFAPMTVRKFRDAAEKARAMDDMRKGHELLKRKHDQFIQSSGVKGGPSVPGTGLLNAFEDRYCVNGKIQEDRIEFQLLDGAQRLVITLFVNIPTPDRKGCGIQEGFAAMVEYESPLDDLVHAVRANTARTVGEKGLSYADMLKIAIDGLVYGVKASNANPKLSLGGPSNKGGTGGILNVAHGVAQHFYYLALLCSKYPKTQVLKHAAAGVIRYDSFDRPVIMELGIGKKKVGFDEVTKKAEYRIFTETEIEEQFAKLVDNAVKQIKTSKPRAVSADEVQKQIAAAATTGPLSELGKAIQKGDQLAVGTAVKAITNELDAAHANTKQHGETIASLRLELDTWKQRALKAEKDNEDLRLKMGSLDANKTTTKKATKSN